MLKNVLVSVAMFVALVPMAQAGLVEVGGGGGSGSFPSIPNVSVGYRNQVLDHSGFGWGGFYGGLIPESVNGDGQVYRDDAGIYRWSASVRASGSFMPEDGSVSETMIAYAALGEQRASVNLSRSKLIIEDDGGEKWEVTFNQILHVNVNLGALVRHDIWQDPDGLPHEQWSGQGNVWAQVSNGLISSAEGNIWRTDYSNQPSSWEAMFNFNGIAMPGDVIIKSLAVPEPAMMAMLGLGGLFLRRRRHA